MGLKAIFSITFGLVTSKVSSKHKEAMEQVLILYQKHRTSSVEPTDITRFMSYMNFYFNSLITDYEAFLDNFTCKLFEIVRMMLSSEVVEYRMPEKQSQVCYPKISSDGDEILTSVLADLRSSDIDLAEIQQFILQCKNTVSPPNEVQLPINETQNMQPELISIESNYPSETTRSDFQSDYSASLDARNSQQDDIYTSNISILSQTAVQFENSSHASSENLCNDIGHTNPSAPSWTDSDDDWDTTSETSEAEDSDVDLITF